MVNESLKFPGWASARSAANGASAIQRAAGRLREWAGRALRHMRAPGAIRDADIDDPLTGQRVQVRVGVLFTRINVNGRDYYFKRLSGHFDGSGAGCR